MINIGSFANGEGGAVVNNRPKTAKTQDNINGGRRHSAPTLRETEDLIKLHKPRRHSNTGPENQPCCMTLPGS